MLWKPFCKKQICTVNWMVFNPSKIRGLVNSLLIITMKIWITHSRQRSNNEHLVIDWSQKRRMSEKESGLLTQPDIHELIQQSDCPDESIFLKWTTDFCKWRKKCYKYNQLVEVGSLMMNSGIEWWCPVSKNRLMIKREREHSMQWFLYRMTQNYKIMSIHYIPFQYQQGMFLLPKE